MAKPPTTWKHVERKVAELLDGERTHWAPEDVRAQGYAVEVKHGDQIPKWLLDAWSQAVTNGDGLPMLVIHPPYWSYGDSMVVVSMSHMRELLGLRDNDG